MKNGTSKTMTFFVLCIAAMAAVAGLEPSCWSEFSLPGGSCSKWVDVTDPETCPDMVLNTNECLDVMPAESGSDDQIGYDSPCTMRQKSWHPTLGECVSQNLAPVNMRCKEEDGSPCNGCGSC